MYTRLEAINLMLEATGQLPVTSPDITTPAVVSANSTLDRVTKSEQHRGYYFNIDRNTKLYRTADDHIVLPANTHRVEVHNRRPREGVIRAGKLYNTMTNSFAWSTDPLVDITFALKFEDAAPTFQGFVMYAAATEFQAMREGDQAKYQDIQATAQTRLLELRREQTRWAKQNTSSNPMHRKYMGGFRKHGTTIDPTYPGGRV